MSADPWIDRRVALTYSEDVKQALLEIGRIFKRLSKTDRCDAMNMLMIARDRFHERTRPRDIADSVLDEMNVDQAPDPQPPPA